MRAKVDADLCTGCGVCIDICPQVFEMSDDTAVVVCDPVPTDAEDDCKDACEQCPVEAIAIEE